MLGLLGGVVKTADSLTGVGGGLVSLLELANDFGRVLLRLLDALLRVASGVPNGKREFKI